MMVVACFGCPWRRRKSGEAFGGVAGLGGKVTRNLAGDFFIFSRDGCGVSSATTDREATVCDDDNGALKNCLGECKEEGCDELLWWSLAKWER